MSKFTVNNQPLSFALDPETPLLWALRDSANLTGTKYGCGTGECGACIVDIDGRAVPSCQVSIKAVEGSFITTIEGLSDDRSHPVQQAWIAENVTQCGYCDPGMIMAASVLLKHNKLPSESDIRAGISNICRCGIYPRVQLAILHAARIMAGSERVAGAQPPEASPSDALGAVPALTRQNGG